MEPMPFGSARQLGAGVRAARERAGLTQVELARRAGVERQWLVLFETGKVNNPTLGKVFSVVAALRLRLQVAPVPDDEGPSLDEVMG
jgi:HTH-type transcriptional regulator/antitoxin HipB